VSRKQRIKLADNPWTALPPIRPSEDQRVAVFQKYARLSSTGMPCRCFPGLGEVRERQREGLPPMQSKIIFETLADATAAMQELRKFGNDPTRAYVCPRSASGHAHFTRIRP
jgi:hypothetical protein